jgi:hypothetical protein
MILTLGLGSGQVVLTHSDRCLSTSERVPERDAGLARMWAFTDVPIDRPLLPCGAFGQRFE